jgi:phosphoribosylformimino-5-aminoimidazole carboxamide ribotide isomerase
MEIIPAIDLRGGRVVRLFRGEYQQETVYSDNPAEFARCWQDQGAAMLHLVDLDGARDGMLTNYPALQAIVENVSITTELGGGLRDLDAIDMALDHLSIDRAILGSILLEKPEFVVEAAHKYPNRIVLGIDARDGMVATRGWRETSSVKAVELVQEFSALPIAAVIYTDISRDGTLEGPNLAATREMALSTPFPLIASGGIGELTHLQALAELAKSLGENKITGVIVGKALYEKKFSLEQAIQAVK